MVIMYVLAVFPHSHTLNNSGEGDVLYCIYKYEMHRPELDHIIFIFYCLLFYESLLLVKKYILLLSKL